MLLFVVLINDPSYLFIIFVEEVFISSLISSKQLFFVSGRISPQVLRCFHKPTTSLFFSLLVFQQLRSIPLVRMLFKFNCGRSCLFLLRFFSFQLSSFYSLFRRRCVVSHFNQSSRFLKIMFVPCLSI